MSDKRQNYAKNDAENGKRLYKVDNHLIKTIMFKFNIR